MGKTLFFSILALSVGIGFWYKSTPLANPSHAIPRRTSTPSPDYFINKQGLAIFTRKWVGTTKPRARIFLVHGYAEHSGRYEWVGSELMKRGYDVYALDHQGHGKSDGEICYVEAYNDFVDDFYQYVDLVLKESKHNVPNFLFGHSLGGALVLLAGYRNQSIWNGIFSSAPAVVIDPSVAKPHLVAISGFLSKYLPKLTVPGEKLESSSLARDPIAVANYDSDPLIYRGPFKARLARQVLEMTWYITDQVIPNLTVPIFVAHGTDDRVTSPSGSRIVYDGAVKCNDKDIKLYSGLYHELLNEPEKEQVLSDIINWYDKHL